MKEEITIEKINLNEIVKVEQLPKLFVQLELIGQAVDEALNGIDKFECTEENKQEVKKRREEINKFKNVLETRRKEIKKQIMEPYDAFNAKYEETVKGKLDDAIDTLDKKIGFIEDAQKQEKRINVEAYFNEYCESLKIDFIEFEQLNLKINLSTTETNLKEQVKTFLDKVKADLETIDTLEHKEEILIEYKASLDSNQAIATVARRYKELEEMKQKQESQQEQVKIEQEAVKKVEEVISAPTEIKKENDSEEILEMTFKVRGTREKLKALKEFMDKGEYDYE